MRPLVVTAESRRNKSQHEITGNPMNIAHTDSAVMADWHTD